MICTIEGKKRETTTNALKPPNPSKIVRSHAGTREAEARCFGSSSVSEHTLRETSVSVITAFLVAASSFPATGEEKREGKDPPRAGCFRCGTRVKMSNDVCPRVGSVREVRIFLSSSSSSGFDVQLVVVSCVCSERAEDDEATQSDSVRAVSCRKD